MRNNYKKTLKYAHFAPDTVHWMCISTIDSPLYVAPISDLNDIPPANVGEVINVIGCSLYNSKIPPIARLEPLVHFVTTDSPWRIESLILDKEVGQIIKFILTNDSVQPVQAVILFLDRLFQTADSQLTGLLFRNIVMTGILDLVLRRFRSMPSFPEVFQSLDTCYSLAAKLVGMVQDHDFTEAVVWRLTPTIVRRLGYFSWDCYPHQLCSFLPVVCQWRTRRICRLMRFVVFFFIRELDENEIAFASSDVLDPANRLQITTMLCALLDADAVIDPDVLHLHLIPWISALDLPSLFLDVVCHTVDHELGKASLRLLNHHRKLLKVVIPLPPSWIFDLSNHVPELVEEDAIDLAYAALLEAPDLDEWFGFALSVLAVGNSDQPATDMIFAAKVFYTACISACCQMNPERDLPNPQPFLLLLCELLECGAREATTTRVVQGALLDLLLRYVAILVRHEDPDITPSLLAWLDGDDTDVALTEYLKKGYHQIESLRQACQQLAEREETKAREPE
jgi:hypothetical protein